MNSAQFIALFPAAAGSLFRKHEELNSLVCSALMIQIIRGDIGSCAPIERYATTRLMNRKITEQRGKCGICEEAFTNYSDIVPDHIHPRGMGGSWRDDHPENIQAVHWWCNGDKGSSRI